MGFIGGLFGANAEATTGGWTQNDMQASLQGTANVLDQQQQFANTLAGIASGQPGNPITDQLNNQIQQGTDQGTQAAAALINSQKGISPALAARLGAQNAAMANQQAVGQAVGQAAQQRMSALGMQGNALGQLAQGRQGIYDAQYRDVAQKNDIAKGNAANNAGIAGGLLGAGGAALGKLAHGGEVQAYAEGGEVDQTQPDNKFSTFMSTLGSNLSSQVNSNALGKGVGTMAVGLGKALGNLFAPANPLAIESSTPMAGDPASSPQPAMMTPAPQMMAAHGGQVPAKVSPGEVYLSPDKVEKLKARKGKVDPIKEGKKIPGKAKVKGDSYENDTVDAMLQAGGIVIPRSITQGENPGQRAAEFVSAVLAHSKHKAK